MRRLIAALTVALTFVGCASMQPASTSATSGDGAVDVVAEKPQYEIGDKWIRSDGVYDLVRKEGYRYVFAAANGREIWLDSDLVPHKVARDGITEWYFAPGPTLHWPLRVGATATSTGVLVTNAEGAGAQYEYTVTAYEEVRVPAGTFKAFRIEMTISGSVERRVLGGARGTDTWTRRDAVSWALTMWYAPEVRQFVKTSGYGIGGLGYQVVAIDDATANRIAVNIPWLNEPETPTEQADDQVRAVVFAGRGLQSVTVQVNDAEVFTSGGRPLGRELPIDIPLKLREGRNVLRINARDLSGETAQHTRVLLYTRASDDTSTPAPAPPVIAAAPPPVATPPPAPATPPAPPIVAAPPAPKPPPVVAMVPPPPPPAPPTPPPVAVAPPPLPPLTIAIATPADRAEVDADRLTLAGLVSGGPGVRRVVVSLNGQDVTRVDDGRPQPTVPLNVALPLRDGYNTVVVTVTDAAGIAHQDVRTVRFERPTPLALDVRYPEDGGKFADAVTVLAAVARSSKGIASTRVTLNGVDVADPDERPGGRRDLAVTPPAQRRPAAPRRSVALTLPLTLRAGSNVITVTATESDGGTKQVVRTVTYEPPKAKPAVAAVVPERPQPRRWAVIIGIGKYENAGVPRLRYTVPDAQAMYDLLTGPGGFKKDEVLLLTDTTDRKPTYRNIKWALGTFLARSAGKDDTVLVFFAGHGAPEIDQRGAERDGLAKYLVPIDADPDDLYSTAVPMDELQTIFSRIEAERVVVFIDACYSGAAGGRTFAAKATRAGGLDEAFLERLAKAKGRAIVTASRPSEVSIELPQLGHGIFTYYLVEALKGAADANHDGIVTLQEVYDYVEREVTAKSRAVGGNQHPVMKGELQGALPLVQVAPPK